MIVEQVARPGSLSSHPPSRFYCTNALVYFLSFAVSVREMGHQAEATSSNPEPGNQSDHIPASYIVLFCFVMESLM
jgi:hypothetical protein